jgi:hypothetical protein
MQPVQPVIDSDPTAAVSLEALERIVHARRSVRGFLPTPVPEATLRAVFELAQRAPSNCNVQPWRSYVASGKAAQRVRALLLQRVDGRVLPAYDFDSGNLFTGEYRRLQVDCAVALYNEMGVARDDKQGRVLAARRNFELFDAPHVVFIGMLKSFGVTVALDVGAYLQTLMLAMTAHGIACCPQGSLRNYPDVARAMFDIPDEIGILCGISFGYEDPAVAANRTRVAREPLAANVQFVSE